MDLKLYEDHRYRKKVLAISWRSTLVLWVYQLVLCLVAGSQYRWGC